MAEDTRFYFLYLITHRVILKYLNFGGSWATNATIINKKLLAKTTFRFL